MKALLFTALTIFSVTVFGQKTIRNSITTIPQLSIYNIHGDTTSLHAISKNKLTFIDFWFIPCGPCFVEMNMLHQLYSEYKDNPNISFLTITITDSAFVRPLMENRNSDSNQTFNYFKSLAALDSFRLPVYFIKGLTSKQKVFIKSNIRGHMGYSGRRENQDLDSLNKPDKIFGFSGYPTILIFDKKGKVIYNETGFTKDKEKQQKRKIETLIKLNL